MARTRTTEPRDKEGGAVTSRVTGIRDDPESQFSACGCDLCNDAGLSDVSR